MHSWTRRRRWWWRRLANRLLRWLADRFQLVLAARLTAPSMSSRGEQKHVVIRWPPCCVYSVLSRSSAPPLEWKHDPDFSPLPAVVLCCVHGLWECPRTDRMDEMLPFLSRRNSQISRVFLNLAFLLALLSLMIFGSYVSIKRHCRFW